MHVDASGSGEKLYLGPEVLFREGTGIVAYLLGETCTKALRLLKSISEYRMFIWSSGGIFSRHGVVADMS